MLSSCQLDKITKAKPLVPVAVNTLYPQAPQYRQHPYRLPSWFCTPYGRDCWCISKSSRAKLVVLNYLVHCLGCNCLTRPFSICLTLICQISQGTRVSVFPWEKQWTTGLEQPNRFAMISKDKSQRIWSAHQEIRICDLYTLVLLAWAKLPWRQWKTAPLSFQFGVNRIDRINKSSFA